MNTNILATLFLCYISLVLSQSCKLTDEATGHTYDLYALRKTTKNWVSKTTSFTYYMNICDPMNKDESYEEYNRCPSNIFACQIDAKDETVKTKSLGNKIEYSIVDEGEIEVTISGGDACSNGQARKTIILLHCNKSKVGSPSFVDEAEKCVYSFEWETSAACPTNSGTIEPPVVKDCKVFDKNRQLNFDLTPLSLSRGNWIVRKGDYEYLLNVCGEVHGVRDCSGHGACQIKPSDESFTKTLGKPSLPYIENEVLKLKLTGGQDCHGGEYQRQTTIIFTCLPGENLGSPKFIEETDECMYLFSWESSAACGESLGQQCEATDSENGKRVNLSGLTKTDGNWQAVSAISNDVSTYFINICSNLVPGEHKCRDGVSICQNIGDSGRSLGSYGELIAEGGETILKYSDGDLCPGSTQRVSTDIYFKCDPTATNTRPKLISSKSDCQYLFTWTTAQACETKNGEPTPEGSSSSAGIAVAVVFSLIVVAFLAGFAYNRFVKKEKGVYQIPLFSLCQACYYTGKERFGGSRGIQL